ncbi:hypothetical protein A2164_03775 [Candidatus Curtissbacteria bacterium RBG_13_35_7]|uniref:Glycosyl transferase family 1 domain-containing protein n=1 Tax=Candidatus Curtissbacteria bacterium RBG_13_35_7 TaxID=1797705 RepID=A0A1F5G309_9BACT|nr:MAG: hypothetical protein A2164_03775 [Candidatus Curtissbacteria bacterium RBG_13_35_7]
MNLGIFLSSGESFQSMTKSGQDIRYKEFYLKIFSKKFTKIFIFSYANEKLNGLPNNIIIIPNKYNLHRFVYGFLLPFLNIKKIRQCDVFRAYHLLGTIPAVITKIFFGKPYLFNYSYDYRKFAKIENKMFQYVLLSLIHFPVVFFASKIIITLRKTEKWFSKNKVIYIPNGVDINIFRPKKKIIRERPVILSVGRLEVQKNYKNLILALKNLNIDLVIVGNGSLRDNLIDLAKKNRINLKIIKKIDNTKLPEIYNDANIFVLPSLIEGPNKSILEAMACQLPVIGSNVDGINEVILDGVDGVFCSTTVKSIREKIQKLISNPRLSREIAINARRKVINKFNLSNLLEEEIISLKGIKN